MLEKNILNKGFVKLIDSIGDDMAVIAIVYTDGYCTVDIIRRGNKNES